MVPGRRHLPAESHAVVAGSPIACCDGEMRACAWVLCLVAGCAALDRPDARDPAAQLVVGDARDGGPRDELIVASYNVHGVSADEIARAVEAHPHLRAADILFLQEVEADPGELAVRLGRDVAYAPGYQLGADGSHGVAIASRLPLRDPDVIELPRIDVLVNSARRIALRATVDAGGRALLLYCVHLDNRINPADRRAQLRPVLDDAALTPEMPAIVAGDMNTSPFCWVGHLLPVPCGVQGGRLERMVRARGFDTPVIGSGATSQWIGMRLDAIYTRHLTVGAYGVDDDLRVSDHMPLWAAIATPRRLAHRR